MMIFISAIVLYVLGCDFLLLFCFISYIRNALCLRDYCLKLSVDYRILEYEHIFTCTWAGVRLDGFS